MKRLLVTPDNIQDCIAQASEILRSGGIVIYPTETTYGVGVDVENPQAVKKLLTYKGKRDGKPISVAVANITMAEQYVSLNDTAKDVYHTFLPGPVTIVSTGRGTTAPGIASAQGKVGIRIPKHDLATALIKTFGSGITATGANASNKKRPYSIEDILENTSKKQHDLIDLILDSGELPHNEPSTVIDTTLDDVKILREGSISFHDGETITTQSEEETMEFFASVAKRFRSFYTYSPVLYLFSGEMGAGKTHAIKGLAKGLGITKMITSPTYSVAGEYTFENESTNATFVHIDCWRVQSYEELSDLGLSNYLQEHAVIAIEWSEKFRNEFEKLPCKKIWIELNPTEKENERKIRLHTSSVFPINNKL